MEMRVTEKKMNKEELHALQVDNLRRQCDMCKIYKPDNKHDGCEIKYKLINNDNKVAWKHKDLFIDSNGNCKMFKEK